MEYEIEEKALKPLSDNPSLSREAHHKSSPDSPARSEDVPEANRPTSSNVSVHDANCGVRRG